MQCYSKFLKTKFSPRLGHIELF